MAKYLITFKTYSFYKDLLRKNWNSFKKSNKNINTKGFALRL